MCFFHARVNFLTDDVVQENLVLIVGCRRDHTIITPLEKTPFIRQLSVLTLIVDRLWRTNNIRI